MSDPRKIVIVGGVAGGASAAARARRCNEQAEITIFEKDAHASFANCGLPYYIGGEIAERDKLLVAKPQIFRDWLNIDLRTGHEVLEIDRGGHAVVVRNRATGVVFRQPYDRLILAPGAAPLVPPMENSHLPGWFTLRNLEDTDAIYNWINQRQVQRAVVLGGGFIGLEMAEQLRHRGIQVSLVQLDNQVLLQLDRVMADLVHDELASNGVELYFGRKLVALKGENQIDQVVLSDGTVLPAEMLIVSVGVRPSIDLAKNAGLELGPTGGIAVNDVMQTSDPAIYAVGDAVEYRHGALQRRMRVPLAGPANRAGRVAGEHAATDAAAPMAAVQGTAILRVFGLAAGCTGMSFKQALKEGRDARHVIIQAGHHAGYYPGAKNLTIELVYEEGSGRLLGAQAVGAEGVDKRLDVVATAMHFGGTVADLAGLDLAYAPPFGSAKDPLHMAAFAAANDLTGMARLLPSDADLAGLQVVDVRNEAEVKVRPLPGSVHIPLPELRRRLSQLDPAAPTVTVCHSAKRGHLAARILLGHGFHQVWNLTGGVSMRRG